MKYRNSGTLNSRLLNLKFNNKLGLEIADESLERHEGRKGGKGRKCECEMFLPGSCYACYKLEGVDYRYIYLVACSYRPNCDT